MTDYFVMNFEFLNGYQLGLEEAEAAIVGAGARDSFKRRHDHIYLGNLAAIPHDAMVLLLEYEKKKRIAIFGRSQVDAIKRDFNADLALNLEGRVTQALVPNGNLVGIRTRPEFSRQKKQ